MKIIDRYILQKFLTTFFFCILLLTLIVVVVDISEKTDDFVKSGLSASKIFTNYYLPFIVRIDAMLFPLFTFIAVIFFTAKMADRTETVAILSSGVSLRRFLFPYWVGSILLAVLLWLGYNVVIPKANRQWNAFEAKYIPSSAAYNPNVSSSNYYFKIDSFTYAGLRYFDTTSKSGGTFFTQKVVDNKLVHNLRCDNIKWDIATKKWLLTNVTERFIVGDSQTIKRAKTLLVSYNFKPVDLRKDEFLKDKLTTTDLNKVIALQKLRGTEGINDLLVEKYNRDAIPVSIIILTIIGAVLSSKKVRGGSGFHLAVGVILSVVYILMSRLTVVFATKGNFMPLLAAWLPNIFFGILAYYFYKRADA